MKKLIIIILLMGLIAPQVRAVKIGYFPGLKQLIDKSDAIVILRIDEHIEYQISPTLYTTHLCYIYQTLKGDIPKNARIPIRLMDTQDSFVTPFSFHSTHLIFLTKKRTENEPTEYRTIQFEGANIILSPFGNEKVPEGKTIEQKVKNLIKDAIAYQTKEYEKRQKFLKAMLGQQENTEQNNRISQFDARFNLIKKGMTLLESLKILGMKRHDIYEIEHPDGRLIHTKLYWYSISERKKTVKWEFKIDKNGKVISKNRELKINTTNSK